MSLKTVMPDELKSVVVGIFRGCGVSERDSEIAAGSLVHAHLRGVESHGLIRLAHYVKRIGFRSINPKPSHKLEWTGPSTGMLDGDDGLGHVAVWDAMSAAIERASETGIAFVGVNNSSHCGALSHFAYQAIENDMIGAAFSQTDKGVVPFGGKKPFFGTNPLCFGAPSRSGTPVVLDMATSTVAFGHILKARNENRPIPPTWALDEDGKPTTDAHKGIHFTPAAGAKGYGLGVIVDVLTGVLCGGTFGPHIVAMYSEYEKKRKLCHLVGVIDYKRFGGSEFFLDTVTQMVTEIHDAPTAEGFGRVLAPGEPEYLKELERSMKGIPLEDYVWDDLMALSESVNDSVSPYKRS